jgi:hypothetical protein
MNREEFSKALESESIDKNTLLLVLQFIRKNGDDEEGDHLDADKALLKYINDPEITQTFNDIKKWYA